MALIGGPKRLSTQVTGIAAGFFIPLFFVVLGAKLDLRAVVHKPSILELTALLTVANVAVHVLAAAVTRQQLPAALVATAQLGLPAGVVTLGLQHHVISRGPGRRDPAGRPDHDRALPGGSGAADAWENHRRSDSRAQYSALNVVAATDSYERWLGDELSVALAGRSRPQAPEDGRVRVPFSPGHVLPLARPARAAPHPPG